MDLNSTISLIQMVRAPVVEDTSAISFPEAFASPPVEMSQVLCDVTLSPTSPALSLT